MYQQSASETHLLSSLKNVRACCSWLEVVVVPLLLSVCPSGIVDGSPLQAVEVLMEAGWVGLTSARFSPHNYQQARKLYTVLLYAERPFALEVFVVDHAKPRLHSQNIVRTGLHMYLFLYCRHIV